MEARIKGLTPLLLGICTLASLPCFASAAAVFQIQPLAFEIAGNSAQPSVAPDAKRGEFVLSWQTKDADGCSALKLASLKPSAKLGQVRQAGQGCNWFVNWADFPSVAIADNGDWLTHWLQKSTDAPYAYDIKMTRSMDQGLSWQTPFSPHSDATPTEHGFVSMAPIGGDQVLAVWLDGRSMATSAVSGHDHASHAHTDAMTLRSAVIGRDAKRSHDLEIDASVCSCCNTDLARTQIGANAAHSLVFRDRSSAEIRDIGLARHSGGRWKSEGLVHVDNWKIAGCPVNGPAIASQGKAELVAWTTMQGDSLSVRARNLSHAKAKFIELESGAGVLGHVDAAAWGKSNWLISWQGAGSGGKSALMLAELDSNLTIIRKQMIVELPAGRSLGIPRLASLPGQHAVLVWTQATGAGKTQIHGVQVGAR